MKIHVYSLCWNDRQMLPFYMRHYSTFADEIFIADDGSDDGSVDYLSQFPQVHLERFENTGDSFVLAAQQYYNTCWKNSKGKADWVLICNIDEHVYHPRMLAYLQKALEKGVTYLPAIGYDMACEAFPEDDGTSLLSDLVTQGIPTMSYTKLALFNPNTFEELNFGPGRHKLEPEGKLVGVTSVALKLLHYKFMGLDYVAERHALLGARLKEGDIRNKYGSHYFKPIEDIQDRIDYIKDKGVNVHTAKEYVSGQHRK